MFPLTMPQLPRVFEGFSYDFPWWLNHHLENLITVEPTDHMLANWAIIHPSGCDLKLEIWRWKYQRSVVYMGKCSQNKIPPKKKSCQKWSNKFGFEYWIRKNVGDLVVSNLFWKLHRGNWWRWTTPFWLYRYHVLQTAGGEVVLPTSRFTKSSCGSILHGSMRRGTFFHGNLR